MARPCRVRMRSRKPWVRFRRRLFGWKVLFTIYPCFWSTISTPRRTWHRSPKFQRRNTLLKSGVRVKVDKGAATTTLDGWRRAGAHLQHIASIVQSSLAPPARLSSRSCPGCPVGEGLAPSREPARGSPTKARPPSLPTAQKRSRPHCVIASLRQGGRKALPYKKHKAKPYPLLTAGGGIWRRGWDSNPRTA